jgi:hypothetical protein
MLRRVRNKLRMIRYYSARRQATVWSRAFDTACIAAVVLALPIAWVCNSVVQRQVPIMSVTGHVHQLDDKSYLAVIDFETGRRTNDFGKPEGNFKIEVVDQRRGWPFPTSITRRPAKLELDILAEPRPRGLLAFDPADPIHKAIDVELLRTERFGEREAWQMTSIRAQHHWKGWLASTAIWLIMLVGASSMTLGLARYSAQILGGKRSLKHRQLRAQGKCVGCGYDMTGLEFNERCPECGSLVY